MKTISLFTLLIIASLQLSAQCRTFVKNNCESLLDDYLVSGRMYGGYVSQGQEMELNVVLNGGQKYRLINCSKANLGNVQVQLIDNKGNVVYDNVDHDYADKWDFNVKSTQEFKVRTVLPIPDKSSPTTVRDCSILIIGSKSAS
jgi:hypothetical protein